MKKFKLFLVTALLSMVVGQSYAVDYTATSSDKDQGMVDVTGNSTTSDYTDTHTTSKSQGTTVYFHAKANDGYKFVGWSETKGGTTYVSTENPYKVTVGETAYTLYAVFAAKVPGELEDNQFYIKFGDQFVTTGSSSSLKLSDTPLAWTFTVSSGKFNISSGKNYIKGSSSSSFSTSTSAQTLYIFGSDQKQVTSLSSLTEGDSYYIAYQSSGSYYLMKNDFTASSKLSVKSNKLTLPSKPEEYQFTLTKSAVTGKYFGKVTATATTGGQVVIDANETATSGFAAESVKSWGAETNSEEKTWYFHAQANSGYEFMAWAEDAAGKKAVSKDEDFSVNVTATSEDKNTPNAKQYYAIFRKVESGATINGYYLKNMGNSNYLQMVKAATDTSTSDNNDGQLGFVESSENATSWVFTGHAKNNKLVKFADGENQNALYFGQPNSKNPDWKFKLVGIDKYSTTTNIDAQAKNQTSAGDGSKYNCYLYKIDSYTDKGSSFTATLTTTAEADGYYFIASANVKSGSGLKLMGSTTTTYDSQITVDEASISATPGASSITVSVSNIKNYIYQTIDPNAKAETVEVTVSSAGYATYCSDKDLVVPADETVFGAKSKDDVVSLIPVDKGDVIPAGEGIIIKKIGGGTVTFNISKEAGVAIAENELKGTTEYEEFTQESIYLLGVNDGNAAFMLNKGSYLLAPNKAYLDKPANAKQILYISEDTDDATAINSVSENLSNAKMYNLNGIQVNKNYKGIVIKDGKKYLMK